ncbi:hypothetical protein BWK60_13375 [Flavobacterium covae]|nr:hypothetical protein BWK60_13375 [Flavobacterium covae]
MGKNFTGYIFNEKHFVFMSIENQEKRYTPTKNEIYDIEDLLKKEISCMNKNLINQPKGFPKIHRKMGKYIRQYVGFINKSNEKVIWINFIWKDNYTKKQLSEDIINVHDGGSYYWNIQINLTKKTLSNLQINGVG